MRAEITSGGDRTDDHDLHHLRLRGAGHRGAGGRRRAVRVVAGRRRRDRARRETTTCWPPATRPARFELARWAAANLTPAEQAAATVYTSGEHCPMCAAAHGWVGLGRIVYAVSSEQLAPGWPSWGPPPPVRTLPIGEVVPGLPVEGPAPELAGGPRPAPPLPPLASPPGLARCGRSTKAAWGRSTPTSPPEEATRAPEDQHG